MLSVHSTTELMPQPAPGSTLHWSKDYVSGVKLNMGHAEIKKIGSQLSRNLSYRGSRYINTFMAQRF